MRDLRFESLRKSYGAHQVLDGVSATISCGITGVLGSNGAGKTTLIRILAGLLPCDSGEFAFEDQKIDVDSHFWRERVGYLPQSPGLYERMTVYDFLDYMLLLSAWKKKSERGERIEKIVTSLNLRHQMTTPIGNLSGGTKQRAAIAQALIHDPGVIFLDEPTNNLDAEERQRLHDFLFSISSDKITLFIGHIVNELSSFCAKVLVFRDGKIVFHDTPAKLILNARDCVREVSVALLEFEGSVKSTLRIMGVEHCEGAVVVRFDARFGDMSGSVPASPTLEEAYKALLWQ